MGRARHFRLSFRNAGQRGARRQPHGGRDGAHLSGFRSGRAALPCSRIRRQACDHESGTRFAAPHAGDGAARIALADRRTRDYTLNNLRYALAEFVACFPVYRTYIVDRPSAQDRRYIDWAIAQARRRSRDADTTIFDFVRRVLLNEPPDDASADLKERVRSFAVKCSSSRRL